MRVVVTNISAGPSQPIASIQLVEVHTDSPVPGQPVSVPQGNSTVQLVVPIAEASKYPVGSAWDMNLTQAKA